MAKFKMECQVCGQPIEVRTGWFAKKYFTCECGNITGAIKIVEEKCPECHRHFMYDRSKEMSPVCPRCNHVIDREARFKKAIETEAEKRKNGIGVERSPFYTVDLSNFFNKDSRKEDSDSSTQE